MKIKIIFGSMLVTGVLTGCDRDDPMAYTPNGEVRQQLFKQCMEFAKQFDNKLEQLSLDDSEYANGIADIIDQCDSTSYYQAKNFKINEVKAQ